MIGTENFFSSFDSATASITLLLCLVLITAGFVKKWGAKKLLLAQGGVLLLIFAMLFLSLKEQLNQVSAYDWFWDLGSVAPIYFSYEIQPLTVVAWVWMAFFVLFVFGGSPVRVASVLGVFFSWFSHNEWSTLFSFSIVMLSSIVVWVDENQGIKKSKERINHFFLKLFALFLVLLFAIINATQKSTTWSAMLFYLAPILATAWFYRQKLSQLLGDEKRNRDKYETGLITYVFPVVALVSFLKNTTSKVDDQEILFIIQASVVGLLVLCAFFALFIKQAQKNIGQRLFALPLVTVAVAVFSSPYSAIYYFILQSVFCVVLTRGSDEEELGFYEKILHQAGAVASMILDLVFVIYILNGIEATGKHEILKIAFSFLLLIFSTTLSGILFFSIRSDNRDEQTKDRVTASILFVFMMSLTALVFFLEEIALSLNSTLINKETLLAVYWPLASDWQLSVPVSGMVVLFASVGWMYSKYKNQSTGFSERLPAVERAVHQESLWFVFWDEFVQRIDLRVVPIVVRIKNGITESRDALFDLIFEGLKTVSFKINEKKTEGNLAEKMVLPLSKLVQVAQNGNIKWYMVFSFFWTIILLLNYLKS